jgi:hypothetical protein
MMEHYLIIMKISLVVADFIIIIVVAMVIVFINYFMVGQNGYCICYLNFQSD